MSPYSLADLLGNKGSGKEKGKTETPEESTVVPEAGEESLEEESLEDDPGGNLKKDVDALFGEEEGVTVETGEEDPLKKLFDKKDSPKPKDKPKSKAKKAAKVKATKAVAKKEEALPATEEDLKPGVSTPGLQTASFGTKVARFPISRYKASYGIKDRLAIPALKLGNDDLLAISRVHWTEETGYFYCFDGECCEQAGLPEVRYNIPAIQYDTDKHGTIVSADFELVFLRLPEKRYEGLLTLFESGVDLTKIDLVTDCDDEQYQRFTLANVGPASWRKSEEFAKMVLERLIKGVPYMSMVIATKLSREKFLEKMGISDTGSAAAEEFDLESFMKGEDK